MNSPYLSEAWSWQDNERAYKAHLLRLLENNGLEGILPEHIVHTYTPEQIGQQSGAYRGAIYGISSNSARQAFFRPQNRSRDIAGLWFAGGTTHPGGGTPLAALSGQLVAEYIAKEK